MKKLAIFAAKTAAFMVLLAASLVSFLIAYVTIGTDPWIWLTACIGCIVCFMLAIGISLGVFESEPKAAPRATTRTATSSGNTSDTVAA